jgi:hypothetical protein
MPRPGRDLRCWSMRSAADTSTDRLATVVEAADILGITPDAVRSRLRRGTLKRSPERGEDGEVLVSMPAPKNSDQSSDKSETVSDRSADQSATDRDASPTVALVEALRDQVSLLTRQLDEANERDRENRRIIAGLVQRVPELEAPPEPREGRVTASDGLQRGVREDQREAENGLERRSWWRAFFGLE